MKKKTKFFVTLFSGLALCFSLISIFSEKQEIQANAAEIARDEIDPLEYITQMGTVYLTFNDKYGLKLDTTKKLTTYDISNGIINTNGQFTVEISGNWLTFSRRISSRTYFVRGQNSFGAATTNTYNKWDTRIVKTVSDCYAVLYLENGVYAKISDDGTELSVVSDISDASKCKIYRTSSATTAYTADYVASFFNTNVGSLWNDETNEVGNLETLKIRWLKAYYKYFKLTEEAKTEFTKPIDECSTAVKTMLETYNKILEKYGSEDIFEFFGYSLAETSEETAKRFNNDIDLYCNGGNNPTLTGNKSVSSAWAQAEKDYTNLDKLEKGNFEGGTFEGELFTVGITNEKIDLNESSTIPFSKYITSGNNYIDNVSYDNTGGITQTRYIVFNSLTFQKSNDYSGCFFEIDFKENSHYKFSELKIKYSINYPIFEVLGSDISIVLNFTDGTNTSHLLEDRDCLDNGKLIEIGDKELDSISFTATKGTSEGGDYVFGFTIKDIEVFGEAQFEQSEEILEMIEKYRYVYGKYGSTIGEDFLGLFDYDPATQGKRLILANIKNISNSSWIIAVVSIIGLTSVGAYFFYRKRKEE